MPKDVGSAPIRAELARAGFDQKDLAEWIGVHPSQISARMQGRIEWRVSELRVIAEHLGVPLATLLDDEPAAAESA
jgi:ribosome-binding protein aMBF1 (putative translation factor)